MPYAARMGKLTRALEWLGLATPDATFADPSPRPIDLLIHDMMNAAGRVTRERALSVPSVRAGRNIICSVATLPLGLYDEEWRPLSSEFFRQYDRNVANVTHLAQTIEDLVCDAIAWWQVTERDPVTGFPVHVRRVAPGIVSLTPPEGRSPAPLPSGEDPRDATMYVDGKPVSVRQMIRFDSPNPGLLTAGPTINRAWAIEAAAAMYANNPRPLDYFTPREGADPASDDAIRDMLTEWETARRRRSTAYVPYAVDYHAVDTPSPADLQLAELQRQANLDVANLLGISPEDLGVSTTSRTYQNAVDRRRDRINDTLTPYMRAITDRLSMGDISPVGQVVAFDLNAYLEADPKTRAEVDDMDLANGTRTLAEVRAARRLTPPAVGQAPARPDNVVPIRPGARLAADAGALTLELDAETLELDAETVSFEGAPDDTFSVDVQTRTITGLVVPWDRVATRNGRRFRFARGSLTFSDMRRSKLLRDHDRSQPLGVLTAAQDTPAGMVGTWRIAAGPAGDAALALAADGVLDGLSPGVEIPDGELVPDPNNRGVWLVRRSHWRETSLTAMPAFDDSRVMSVTATADQGDPMPCSVCNQVHAEGVAACPPTIPPAIPAAATAPAAEQTFTADQMRDLVRETIAELRAPGGPAFVDPRQGPAQVTEAAPYTFAGDDFMSLRPGTHDFSRDIFAAYNTQGSIVDLAAHQRLTEWLATIAHQFDVVSSNVATLNPTEQRPNMYVDQREFRYPVWNSIAKGSLNEITPFTFPKFSSSGSLVGAHTEGVEPGSGTFVATSQTVTPSANSGKAKISREVWDAGGNPQVSNLIWRQMLRAWFESLEAAAVAIFTANAASITDIPLTAGGGTTGQTLAAELKAALASLHFVRGGFSMTDAVTQIDLYKAMAAAQDDTGRPLFPVLGPNNADGQVSAGFGAIDIGAGVMFRPAWALAASGSVVASSFLYDRESVHGWAGAPQRIDITQTEVANVYIGLFGYKATAISDFTGTREITYDPVP